MQLSILQQDLLPLLQSVSRSIGVRTSLPVLGNVLLQAETGKIKLSATNLELGVIKQASAKIQEEGQITIPAKTFLEVISSLSGMELLIEATQDQVRISSKNFNATLNGIAAAEFPTIPLATEKSVSISASVLSQSLPQITFAAATDEGRPILTGILTEIKKGNLELVATDGFRLAYKNTPLAPANESKQPTFRALIPRKTFEEVVRLIAEDHSIEDGQVEISTSENQNQMIFKIGDTQLSSRLIEGQFPSWEKIIPTTIENETVIDRAELLRAVKLASVFAKDAANIVKLQTLNDHLKLSSEAKDLGAQETELEAKIQGSPIQIAFNAKFLTDALMACNSNEVKIQFSGNLSPALIKPQKEEGLEYVIMPIRLN